MMMIKTLSKTSMQEEDDDEGIRGMMMMMMKTLSKTSLQEVEVEADEEKEDDELMS